MWAEDTASFHVQIKLSLITEPSMRFRAEKKKKKKKKQQSETLLEFFSFIFQTEICCKLRTDEQKMC